MAYGGVDAARSGTRIFFLAKDGDVRPLNVAEACAGLRSLMTFISLAAAIAFLSNRPLWQRGIIVLSAIPIAIFCNVMRVSGQGLTDYYISEQFGRGFAHNFYGLGMYVPAFFMVLMVVWILDHLFIDQADELEKARLAGAARSKLIVTKSAPKLAAAASTAPALTAPAPVAKEKPTVAAAPSKPAGVAAVARTAAGPAVAPVRRTPPTAPAPAAPGAAKPAAPAVTPPPPAGKSVAAPAPRAAASPVGGAPGQPQAKPPAQPKPPAVVRPNPQQPEGTR
jgi:exosortase/archaeosortase family protein